MTSAQTSGVPITVPWRRVALVAGQSQTVALEASADRLFYIMAGQRHGIEAGDVTVVAGLSSADVACSATA